MWFVKRYVQWYLSEAVIAQLRFTSNALTVIDDTIGLSTNVRFFFTPIFGDITFIGRILTLIIRSTIIALGAAILVVIATVLFLLPLFWYSLIFIWILFPVLSLFLLLTVLYFLFYGYYKPQRLRPFIHQIYPANVLSFCNFKAINLLKSYTTSEFYELAKNDGYILHFIQRSALPFDQLINILKTPPFVPTDILIQTLIQIAIDKKVRYIRSVHIFAALLECNQKHLEEFLRKNHLDMQIINKYIGWEEYEYSNLHPPKIWEEDYHVYTGGGVNRTWQGTVTPTLNQYSEDITNETRYERYKVIRTTIIEDIERVLQKTINSNVILLGDIGSGKDTLVREIAHAIDTGEITGSLWSKRIIQLDIGRLFGGATDKGSFEERVENILEEITRSKNIILYLNDLNSSLQTKTNQGISLFALLQSALTSNKLHIIASVTSKEYRNLEENDPGFLKQFELIKVPETNEQETTHILHNKSIDLEYSYNLYFPFPAIDTIYSSSVEYFNDTAQPKKAINLLEDVALYLSKERNLPTTPTKYGNRIIVTNDYINQVITKKTDIPVGTAKEQEALKLLNLEQEFSKKIIDQSEAVHSVSEVLRRNRSGLRRENKPIGSFLFVGPTGVGKTELAKTLAGIFYNGENHLIRLDMSEYQNQDSIDRIIGGNDEDVLTLTQKVAKQPFSLLLLDELEKAHPKILDLFLQVLDDSRLTDTNGTTVNFNQTIIIATSNAGTTEITNQFRTVTSESQYQEIQKLIYKILTPYFRIEFLNRFDEIILFKPLTQKSIEKIVLLQLDKIASQIYQKRKIKIDFKSSTIQNLVKNGYDQELGARPLQREIQNTIESQLARLLLEGTVADGQTITL